MRTRLLVAMIVTVALVAAGCSSAGDNTGDENAPPDSTIATTTIPEEAPHAAIAVVVSALEAKNSRDLGGWLAAYEGGKSPGTPLFAEEILMNANQHWEVVEPCHVTGETVAGDTIVECLIKDINDFWGVGGISDTESQTFTVNEDGLISDRRNIFASGRRDAFNSAFHQWLSDTYPDVYEELDIGRISSNGPGFDAGDPGHILLAVEYVEEFIDQSDIYPLNSTDQ